jgi:peptidoglycan/LPS O-acetylase OafA/YrhL
MPFLDFVRIGAAILVLFGHVRGLYFVGIASVEEPGILTKGFYLATSMQHEAVVLFFVVSGFLIGGPLWEKIGSRTFRPKEYLIHRFARIYIVLIPALALVLLLQWAGILLSGTRLIDARPLLPAGVTAGFTWDQVPCHLLALPAVGCAPWGANPPLWSLGYEWLLYLLAPLAIAAIRLPSSVPVSACLVALLTAVVLGLQVADWPLWFGAWAIGAVSRIALRMGRTSTMIGFGALALCAVVMIFSRTGVVPSYATDAAIAVLLALSLSSRAVVSLNIAPRVVRPGAECSYSLYLIHLPIALVIGAALTKWGWPSDLSQPGLETYSAFCITIALSVLAAVGFARVTEANTEQFRAWLTLALKGFPRTEPKKAPPAGADGA